MPNRVLVSLGSNIDKEKNLPAAVRLLSRYGRVVAISTVYETRPVGLVGQPNFLNAAALVETELDAGRFKREVLARIEAELGRRRAADKNAPRTIDADITLFNDAVFDLDEGHHIPDPGLLEFAHVAVPAAELAPDLPHPETGEPLSAIAARLVAAGTRDGERPVWERPDIALKVE
ncbi:MAG: 2-amino-4-hydroxy-6-hydroxymethyldihydropteridine diphosphokinase [Chloroflexi bacterium]|nr:2-amino-4-hydroxy-6-hydroxymethyldihydropteridine diphosphokinase [Chloroflexota bacterium]MCI0580131.1 2-amino-4-hydroxy-6-hydroxymethyldihydropteridine diphosphokinase [Chloroflexota bacterium]MCI0649293.1 2-amino-4-hydroxy-6-hydroxymethyldihydropteridine diphosphokinase [Chloroflexota bacterium]MCI0725974.1 2-amino-4-hydroxy-6-hydroxymethyldihydropteridine diphosphokinase [Chloroflexota bacterium]